MKVSWLHVSDFHFKGGDPYDRDVVLRALVRSVRGVSRRSGRQAGPDLRHRGRGASAARKRIRGGDGILRRAARGGGQSRSGGSSSSPATTTSTGDQGIGLARTLGTREEADAYFGPNGREDPHPLEAARVRALVQCLLQGHPEVPARSRPAGRSRRWISAATGSASCRSTAPCSARATTTTPSYGLAAAASMPASRQLKQLGAELNVALVHHPLDWLHEEEGANIRTALQSGVDVILRGHLAQDRRRDASPASWARRCTWRRAPPTRRANGRTGRSTAAVEDGAGRGLPDPLRGRAARDLDASTRASSLGAGVHQGIFHPAVRQESVGGRRPLSARPSRSGRAAHFRSNIPSRRNLPFVGRDDLLGRIGAAFADRSQEAVLVLHGPPGVGKSELAREFARRQARRLPGRPVHRRGRQAGNRRRPRPHRREPARPGYADRHATGGSGPVHAGRARRRADAADLRQRHDQGRRATRGCRLPGCRATSS